MPLLEVLGVAPVNERVVFDRNHVATAGVSAGIDGALSLVAKLYGDDLAATIQLMIEYDPVPPFDTGSVNKAPDAMVAHVRSMAGGFQKERLAAAHAAASRVGIS
jgi:cyclohexyl-isocyanide hydratase